jgi:hypothetical protein
MVSYFALGQSNSTLVQFRKEIPLQSGWETILKESSTSIATDFVNPFPTDGTWKKVDVPHNWDQYYGYRRAKHGNLHGTAWYNKKLKIDSVDKGKRFFLFFEGVGSYATVWFNGKKVGTHKGGRTTFTIDITDALEFDKINSLTVKAEHPALIADLPWVCGGCSGEWGFSEGSQPLGIFRPVSLIITNDLRIEPFGVHIWNDTNTTHENAILHASTTIKNYGNTTQNATIVTSVLDAIGKTVSSHSISVECSAGETKELEQILPPISQPNLWSPGNPYRYQVVTTIFEDHKKVDQISTPYGIRWISWPINREGNDSRLYINDQPFFINGTCEYEHLIGNSHSFSNQQIQSRIAQIKSAGFNAFREAHQPHNLRYQEVLDQEGILFWSQFSAHIWYDTPEFKENFKTLLREWIKERRNSPSIVLWGLQNESTIPKEFAAECTQIIREMDPSSASQRLVTTCNGGEGTDWNVVQNWSGTYGGDPYNYDVELSRQLLNGEYGAWRSADWHSEGELDQKGILTENRFSQLMELKVRKAEFVKDKVVGQFNWLFASHENPGRIQDGEGFRDIDKIGPVNYKGLFTVWGEPLDAYYMYRANYVSNKKSPMVYIVSHSWPNRWESTGIKNGIEVYSNCDEVELFNDLNQSSLGKIKNLGLGMHFQWDNVNLQYNLLHAVGYVNGKAVAKDYILLPSLPKAPHLEELHQDVTEVIQPQPKYNYIYRVNCGGPEYKDHFGNRWLADTRKSDENIWGSLSWTDSFKNLPAYYGSQRTTYDPIKNTKEDPLFQTFRYGTNQLQYEFPVPNGEYLVELYFNEPWYGTGGGMDCKGWRQFDVAINSKTVLNDFDIWSEAGHDAAVKKIIKIKVTDGKIRIHFPRVNAGQALISAIAIATLNPKILVNQNAPRTIQQVRVGSNENNNFKLGSWLDLYAKQYTNSEASFTKLPSEVFGADYIQFALNESTMKSGSFVCKEDAKVYVFIDAKINLNLNWLSNYTKILETAKNSQGTEFSIFTKKFTKGEPVIFGENPENSSMYSIAVVPIYDMGGVDDARPTLLLEAENAKFTGEGVVKGTFKKSDYVEYTQTTPNSVQFEVKPGVAAIYLMRFKYMNTSDTAIKVNFKIEDANGIVVKKDVIEFSVAADKWKILNTSSGGYINAGSYTISLESTEMKGLRLDSLEFQ